MRWQIEELDLITEVLPHKLVRYMAVVAVENKKAALVGIQGGY